MAAIQDLLTDLAAESAALDALVAPLDPAGWRTATPAPGWSIAHQIAHLAWTDEVAKLAAADPAAFGDVVAAALQNAGGFADQYAEEGARAEPAALLERWRLSRAGLAGVLAAVDPEIGLPWFGPPMGASDMVTARIMETFAHGRDIADALGAHPEPTDRLRHIVQLGVRTRNYAFRQNGLEPPAEHFRFEITAPDGSLWAHGPETGAQRVSGPALDFCLLVTRRRHPADLAVTVEGPDAERWLGIAQAFAGPSGAGREKGQFA